MRKYKIQNKCRCIVGVAPFEEMTKTSERWFGQVEKTNQGAGEKTESNGR